MYAVIKTGGKQYRVTEGDILKVEKLPQEKGSSLEITDVLSIGEGGDVKAGSPAVSGARVVCEVVGHGLEKKVLTFKKKRRKGYTKKIGHRQNYTSIRIKEIKA
ncbi:MAG: 50S ribosomal protein L21 [Deltaproteobacteria bacterium]|nr:50S ribosomal protein L21 [Deltaproteobacteria bacterium]